MLSRTVSGIGIVLLALAVAAAHFFANTQYLYWRVWWFDIPMHFFGGLLIGSIVLWFIAFEIPVRFRARVPRFLTTLVLIFVTGILWEVFEYQVGAYVNEGYTLDTFLDLGMDVAGMLGAYLVFSRYVR